ncbi:hypothetical protein BD560DRAFT_419357 [Blakeslea trispora]|nr:hypothetical protein BD560DRAFT_419357 [Blakeslea trispora]
MIKFREFSRQVYHGICSQNSVIEASLLMITSIAVRPKFLFRSGHHKPFLLSFIRGLEKKQKRSYKKNCHKAFNVMSSITTNSRNKSISPIEVHFSVMQRNPALLRIFRMMTANEKQNPIFLREISIPEKILYRNPNIVRLSSGSLRLGRVP